MKDKEWLKHWSASMAVSELQVHWEILSTKKQFWFLQADAHIHTACARMGTHSHIHRFTKPCLSGVLIIIIIIIKIIIIMKQPRKRGLLRLSWAIKKSKGTFLQHWKEGKNSAFHGVLFHTILCTIIYMQNAIIPLTSFSY